ncbi:hypothetical protein E1B28_012778 [Marasmius oreades]|uniref:Heme haloperoxidase family profile domain-containing protein n=1 Tax=Marasmius oreades TaxID=181124 RepID=A0A9P7RSU1_9AGAR|nr:uncharacterized protein E1B28_012778 [Marasmius oreades]KAG7088822.1 hypothetical protein E1B28_012778 [Marasmius oreades]
MASCLGRDETSPFPWSSKLCMMGINVEPEIVTLAAKFALIMSKEPTTFSLNDLKAHNVIEHDSSLSRQDIALGDNVPFNETIFSTLANSNPGSDVYNTTSARQVQDV